MIRKLLLSISLLALFAIESTAQYAPDSLQIAQANIAEGQSLKTTGAVIAITGGSIALLGGGAALLGLIEGKNNNTHGPGMLAVLGLSTALSGCLIALVGVPFIISGNAIMKTDDGAYWKRTSFSEGTMRGFGLVLEGGYLMGYPFGAQFRAVIGHHVNEHVFVGGGIAPSYDLEGIGPEGYIPIDLPIFADFRYSFGGKRLAPYLGASLGVNAISERWPPSLSHYSSLEAGLRWRLSKENGHALWLSALAESSDNLARFGLKMGYSF